MRNTIVRLLPDTLRRALNQIDWLHNYSGRSYAQEGEDLILSKCFPNNHKGFFVDIGAHHPKRFSNTYLFYRRGWRGINIDAMPGSMKRFRQARPADINLEMGIAQQQGSLTYYMFDEPALNGFSRDLSIYRAENTPYRIVKETPIPVMPLSDVLEEHLPQPDIDFLSTDVEGFDLQVLKSNDWTRFRPSIVLTECLNTQDLAAELKQNPVIQFMQDCGYTVFAKTFNTVFFGSFGNGGGSRASVASR